jgi:hypothetical protein
VSGAGPRTQTSLVDGDDLGCDDSQILALREHLIAEKVTCVVLESTSD